MKLHLGFELDLIGLAQPKGEMIMDIDFYAADGPHHADIKEISFCSNALLDALGKMFGKTILADEIAKVINEPSWSSQHATRACGRIEILNGPALEAAAPIDAECTA